MPVKKQTQIAQLKLNHGAEMKINRHYQRKFSIRPITVKWLNIHGFQCKRIVKQNKCFCNHKYGQHQYHFTMKPFCKVKGCSCKCYQYIPHFDIKCLCKHSFKDHHPTSKKCTLCTKCNQFLSSWACKCGFKFHSHRTAVYEQWDKQIKALPEVNKKVFMNHSVDYNQRMDFIEEHSQKQQSQQQPSFTQEQIKLRNRLKMVNKKMQNIQGHHSQPINNKAKQCSQINNESKSFIQTKQMRNSLQHVDYSDTPLQLILKPHKYRFTNISNFINSQTKKN